MTSRAECVWMVGWVMLVVCMREHGIGSADVAA